MPTSRYAEYNQWTIDTAPTYRLIQRLHAASSVTERASA
jgi:hypothetical protein